jgi:hypothetical protein
MHPPQFGGTAADWKKAEVAKRVEKQEIELAKIRGDLLGCTDIEVCLGRTISAIRSAFLQLPGRVAYRLVGLDAAEIHQRLTYEVERLLTGLGTCGYLESSYVEQLVDDLMTDPESTRQLASLDFANQDEATSKNTLILLIEKIMQLIGRRALANAGLQTSDPNSRVDSPIFAAISHAPRVHEAEASSSHQ